MAPLCTIRTAMLALAVLLAGTLDVASGQSVTASTAPADANRLSALRAEGLHEGFELATQPRVFVFPRDHGPHPAYRHEWWYVTGHLDAANGEPFGFELTFFRFGLVPPSASAASAAGGASTASTVTGAGGLVGTSSGEPSAWRARQIYMAHFAVTDIARREFHVEERFARDALGMAGARSDPFHVWLDGWSLGTTDDAPTSEAATRASTRAATTARREEAEATAGPDAPNPAASSWRLVASDESYSLDLDLVADSPVMLNGDAGLSRKSGAAGAASYYYSIPRLIAKGRLTREGTPLDVQGTVWLDREWGSGSLGADQQGWDWFALQLDDGSALMFYALRTRDGRLDRHSAGTWLTPDGSIHKLSRDDVQITVTDAWQSPRGGTYPAGWRMRIPSLQLDVNIEPRLADQELNTSTRYWEGACLVSGTRAGSSINGKAYVELVGYAATPREAGR